MMGLCVHMIAWSLCKYVRSWADKQLAPVSSGLKKDHRSESLGAGGPGPITRETSKPPRPSEKTLAKKLVFN